MRKPIRKSVPQKSGRPDRIKLLYDFLKHLTTLSSGSVVLIVTLSEKLLKDTPASGLLVSGIICFLLAILASLVAMAILAAYLDERPDSEATINTFSGSFTFSAGAFYVGMVLIAISVFSQNG
jgi:hypothetical protein